MINLKTVASLASGDEAADAEASGDPSGVSGVNSIGSVGPKRQYLIAPRIGRATNGLWAPLDARNRQSLLFLLGNRRQIGVRANSGLLPQARIGRSPMGLLPQARVGRSTNGRSEPEVAVGGLETDNAINELLDALAEG